LFFLVVYIYNAIIFTAVGAHERRSGWDDDETIVEQKNIDDDDDKENDDDESGDDATGARVHERFETTG